MNNCKFLESASKIFYIDNATTIKVAYIKKLLQLFQII